MDTTDIISEIQALDSQTRETVLLFLDLLLSIHAPIIWDVVVIVWAQLVSSGSYFVPYQP